MDTKLPIPSRRPQPQSRGCRPGFRAVIYLIATVVVVVFVTIQRASSDYIGLRPGHDHRPLEVDVERPSCPAQNRIAPEARPDITEANVNGLFKSKKFEKLSIERLAGAVQIPTQTFQGMGKLGEDPRWDNFYDLEKYLRKTFPLLHDKVELEVVNEHGLLYTWRGSNEDLKPVLLMAHQDTVPVADDTLSEWVYPPFSGHFDGTYINGRGSHDCKNNVVAILASVTALLEQDFEPRRTVVLSFGFDEETGGYDYGASRLAGRISERWGNNSFAIIVDEGAVGVTKKFGRTFAIPQSNEKGAFDLEMTVHIPGGHSSVPPTHTSIGILAEAITSLENAAGSNFPSTLRSKDPLYTFLQCAAEDSSTDLPDELRDAILDPNGTPKVIEYLSQDRITGSLLHTTQAVTIFHGGNKSNALPAFATVIVNYRVSTAETLDEVRQKLVKTLEPVAEKFGLDFYFGDREDYFGLSDETEASGLPVFTFGAHFKEVRLEPSPVSSTDSSSWTYFSGVIKHVFDEAEADGGEVIVAPMLAGGNTDTRFFWDISSQIYRFGPVRAWHDEGEGNIHDVNERIALAAHLEAILFYHEFIRVFDEAELDDD